MSAIVGSGGGGKTVRGKEEEAREMQEEEWEWATKAGVSLVNLCAGDLARSVYQVIQTLFPSPGQS